MTRLLTAREFASFFRLSEKNGWQTALAWARTGKLKGIAIRIGDNWRFREDKVLALIEKGGMRS